MRKRGIKKKYNWMSKEAMFSMLSSMSNYADEELVKRIYYALVKMMVKEIKSGGCFRMPDFGDFHAKFYKERMVTDLVNGGMMMCPQRRVIKFETNEKLKQYLNI